MSVWGGVISQLLPDLPDTPSVTVHLSFKNRSIEVFHNDDRLARRLLQEKIQIGIIYNFRNINIINIEG